MNTQLAPGETTYRDFGHLNIRIDMHHDGVTILVTAHPGLNRSFTNLSEGRAYLGLLRDMGRAGKPLYEIEDAAGVLTSAAAVLDDAEQALIDDLNADFDQRDKQAEAAKQQELDDAQAIVGDGQGWTRYRQSFRPVRATKSRTYLQPPTDAQLRLMRQHTNGIVRCDDKANWLTLRGIADRGLGVVHEQDRQIITAVRLNARGFQAIEPSSAAA
jgi:hypothetical protein